MVLFTPGDDFFMKLGILTDIHANLAAFEAVLPYFSDCDKILCGGDFVNIGPRPEETVQLAMSLPNLAAVTGNHEGRILRDPIFCRRGPEVLAHYEWTKSRLSEASLQWLGSLPPRQVLTLEGKTVALQHYGLREGGHCRRIRRDPTDDDLRELFPDAPDAVVFGHDHHGCIRRVDGTLFLNCGACGCPGHARNIARAAILTLGKTVAVEPLRIPYDVSPVIRDMLSLDYPDLPHILRAFYRV